MAGRNEEGNGDAIRDGVGVPTRRDVIKGGGALTGAAALSGCVGSGGGNPRNATKGDGDGGGSGAEPYTVEMAPAGEVTFDEPPESVAHYFPGYADMAVALGHADTINSVGLPSRYHTYHYEELDGVGVDNSKLTKLVGDNGIDKEVFYELDSSLHMIDPVWLTNNDAFALDEEDIDELEEKVAPFFGNTIFRRTDDWHDYSYYTMYEAFEKVAEVHQEQERYAAFESLHDEFVAEVRAKLPPADERPNALLCFAADDEPEAFSPYRLTDKGTNKKHFRDLGIEDALSGTAVSGLSETDRGRIDYETILEVDPDSLLVRGHEDKTADGFRETVVGFMEDHPVAGDLTAVQEGRVYRGGPIYTGPLHHLFLTERYAKLYYPGAFSGEMFDRGRVADIVNGDA